jgi:hypothetical protein
MNGLREVYEYVEEIEGNLRKELERVKEWQRRARERMVEDKKWLGRVDYGELEAASKDFAEVKAMLSVIKIVKEKIEEVMVKENKKEVSSHGGVFAKCSSGVEGVIK